VRESITNSFPNGGCVILDPTAALRLYDEAWAIPDYESRLELLRNIWADDGLYVDPDVPEGGRGPEALATHRRTVRAVPGDVDRQQRA
jgi:hypothetical protein